MVAALVGPFISPPIYRPTRRRGGSGRVQPAALEQRPDSRAAVAPAVLFGPLHLTERLPCLGYKKDRVVPETRHAPPLRDHLASAVALEGADLPAGQGGGDGAGEARGPRPRLARQ